MNTPNTLVSIIIPIYNVEKYLNECLESVCAQTYREIEIILVNDGSTDNSISICEKFQKIDNRITIINKKNAGLSAARNSGLEIAKGEYIYFLDSDDYISPDAIELLVKTAINQRLDIISFDGIAFFDEDNPWEADSRLLERYIRKHCYFGVMKGAELYYNQEKNGEFRSPVQTYFFRHDFIKENSLKFYDGILHEDILFMFFAMLYAQRTMHIQVALYYRRMRSDSIMGKVTTEKNLFGLYTVLKEIISFDKKTKNAAIVAAFKDKNEIYLAYTTGIISILNYYFTQYFTLNKKSFETKKQFNHIIKLLNEKEYFFNTEIKRCVDNRRKIQLKKIASKHKALKRLGKNIIKVKRKIKHKQNSLEEYQNIFDLLTNTYSEEKRIILLCVPHKHGNRGDQAIALAEVKLLKEKCADNTIIEIPAFICEFYAHVLKNYVKSTDIFFIHGGGNFGSLWRHNQLAALNVIQYVPDSCIIVFPQTIYYSDDALGNAQIDEDRKAFSKFTNLHIFVRDKSSYDLVKRSNLFFNAKSVDLIPDIVLSLDMQHLSIKTRKGALICLRPDMEAVLENREKNRIYKTLLERFSNVLFTATNDTFDPISMYERKEKVEKLLTQFSESEILITDRLHGMIFAAITGTPCVAMDNLSRKVSGVYSWIKDLDYIEFIENISDLDSAIKRVMSVSLPKYSSKIFDKYYQKIIDCIAK